jgi:RNA recognition motif-containing protein
LKTDEDRYRDRDNRRDFPRDRDYPSRGTSIGLYTKVLIPTVTCSETGYPPREELPLPNKPPYIAFVGNLAFDIYDGAIAEYFSPSPIKDIKIIKDRDDKPKGFGYVEFETLDGLKDALTRTGGVR